MTINGQKTHISALEALFDDGLYKSMYFTFFTYSEATTWPVYCVQLVA